MQENKLSIMLIEAHRGAFKDTSTVDENSLSAFRKAIEFICDFVEFDVHRTKDNQFIILHNNKLLYKNETVFIKDSYWEDYLENYRLPITNESLPLLHDVLRLCKGKIKMNVEIKDPLIGNEVLDIILSVGISPSDFLISSFHESVLQDVTNQQKGIETGFLFLGNLWSLKNVKIALSNSCKAINPYFRFLNRRVVKFAVKNNLDMHLWTVNGKNLKKFMDKKYVTSIITKDVLEALDIRDRL